MKITVARNAGFCFGVRRALDLTFRVRQENPGRRILTVGPIIHNPQVIAALEGCGVGILKDAAEIREGDIAIIRAHGLAPAKTAELKQRGATVIDATCPMVLKVHGLIRQAARTADIIAIAGDRDHPEMEAHLGVAGDKGVLIENLGDIEKIAPEARVALVAQTTFEVGLFHEIAQALRRRVQSLEVTDTICRSTSRRQREVMELAAEHDSFIVIGGRNSANTLRLAEIAASEGRRVYKLETAEQLAECDLGAAERVAVIAGASTPQWLIDDLIAALKDRAPFRRLVNRLLAGLAGGNLLPALGAAGLALLALQPPNLLALLVTTALVLAGFRPAAGLKPRLRWALGVGLALGLVWGQRPALVLAVAGVALLRPLIDSCRFKPYQVSCLDLAQLLAASVALPLGLSGYRPGLVTLALTAFTVFFYLGAQLVTGARTLERDAIMGSLSLARWLADKSSRRLIGLGGGLLAAVLLAASWLDVLPPAFSLLPLPLAGLYGARGLLKRQPFIDQRLYSFYVQSLWLLLFLIGLVGTRVWY